MIGVYFHFDEESVDEKGQVVNGHIHIDSIPFAEGYSSGLEKRNSLSGALEAQGFHHISRKMTREIQWEKSENELLERICTLCNCTVLHPNEGRKHESTLLYKTRKEKESILKAKKELEDEKEALNKVMDEVISPYIRSPRFFTVKKISFWYICY